MNHITDGNVDILVINAIFGSHFMKSMKNGKTALSWHAEEWQECHDEAVLQGNKRFIQNHCH